MTAPDFIEKVLGMSLKYFHAYKHRLPHTEYNMAYQCSNIRVHGIAEPYEKTKSFDEYNDEYQEDETIDGENCYLVLSGKGCDEFFCNHSVSAFGNVVSDNSYSYESFFFNCITAIPFNSFHLTRLDLAIDDKNSEPYFTIDQLKEKCLRGEFVAGSKTFNFLENTFDELSTSKTLYIGKGKSALSYRFYDKDKEISKKENKSLAEIGSWKRTEIQLRDSLAHVIAMHLGEGNYSLARLALGFLGNTLRFVDRNENESNKSRWKTSEFWNNFIGDVEPIKVSLDAPKSGLLETEKWLQVGGALSAVIAFEILEENNALGSLHSIKTLKEKIKFSKELCDKVSSHLISVGRKDLIPHIYKLSKGCGTMVNFKSKGTDHYA